MTTMERCLYQFGHDKKKTGTELPQKKIINQRKRNGERNLVIRNKVVVEKEDETSPRTEPATDRARARRDLLTRSTEGDMGRKAGLPSILIPSLA